MLYLIFGHGQDYYNLRRIAVLSLQLTYLEGGSQIFFV